MSLDFYLQDNYCKHCERYDEVFSANITHNLTSMAGAVGIYEALWRPDENGFVYAQDVITILSKGLSELAANPEKYKQYDSPNGWGKYEHFVEFVRAVLDACEKYPNAKIKVSR